jgi:hypothetical protein
VHTIDRTTTRPSDATRTMPTHQAGSPPLIRFRRRGVDVGELYFEDAVPDELPTLDVLRILSVLEPTSDRPWKRRHTLIVDVTTDEDTLLDRMAKGTRYKVRRAMNRDEVDAESFPSPTGDVVRSFANYYDEFAASRSLPPVFRPRLDAMAQSHMLFLSKVSRRAEPPLAWHAYAGWGGRAMLLYSASLFRDYGDSGERNMIGRANRYLHWRDMLWFKDAGYEAYDLGGVDISRLVPATARIAEFKQGFGGQLRSTNAVTVALSAKGHLARAMLRLRRVDF